MTRYYTPIEGMQGAGNAIVPNGAVKIEDGNQIPDGITGGTYSEMIVNEDLMHAIQQGSAGNFFYFEKLDSGEYKLMPTLPEKGKAKPDSPEFNLRINNNRLVKGIASKFFNADGEFDIKKGTQFICDLDMRFGISGEGLELETLTSTQMPHKEPYFSNSLEWLCSEFAVPQSEKEDFSNFCRAAFGETPVYGFGNFINIWRNWCDSTAGLEAHIKDGDLLFHPEGIPENDKLRELRQTALEKYEYAKKELYSLANINPETEKRLLTVVECMGSQRANCRFAEMAAKANPTQTEQYEAKHFEVNLKEGTSKEDHDKLKWEVHFAPVLGSFQYEGNTYYLTAEAFAPESDTFMDHPAMSGEIAIGVFKNEADFQTYYKKDHSLISNDPEAEAFAAFKNVVVNDGGYIMKQNVESKITNLVALARKVKDVKKTDCTNRMSDNQKRIQKENQEACKRASDFAYRIPLKYQKQYQVLIDTLQDINTRCNKCVNTHFYYEQVREKKAAELSEKEQQILQEISNHNDQKYQMMIAARKGICCILDNIFNKDNPPTEMTEEQKKALTELLRPADYNAEKMEKFETLQIEVKIKGDSACTCAKYYNELKKVEFYSEEEKKAMMLPEAETLVHLITGTSMRKDSDTVDYQAANALLQKVFINGIQYKSVFGEEQIDKTNYERFVCCLADHLSDQIDPENFSKNVAILSEDNVLIPIIYEPEPLDETQNPGTIHWYTSSKKKAEIQAYQEKLRNYECWKEKNAHSIEACNKFNKLRGESIDVSVQTEHGIKRVKKSFADLANTIGKNPSAAKTSSAVKTDSVKVKNVESSK